MEHVINKKNTYIHRYIQTHTHTYIDTHIHTYIHTYIHTHIHTYIHTYTHTSWKEYCNVTASSNPWSQVYKLAAGKVRNNSIMTTLKKPDGSDFKYTRDN